MKKILFILATLFMTSAEATLFTIEQGEHYSSPNVIKPFIATRMNMSVIFDDSARYEFPSNASEDQIDVNKLYGFADCESVHTKNSARFGWRWNNGQLEIMAFTHKNGAFSSKYITSIETNHPYFGSIQLSSDKTRYIYEFAGKKVEMDRGCDDRKAVGYHITPYFGGNQSAPHQITITVDTDEQLGPAFVGLPYPNPVTMGKFKLKVSAYDNFQLYFTMYDMTGRKVYKSDKKNLSENEESEVEFDIGKQFASAMYLIVPIVLMPDGTELRAGITNLGSQKSLKLMIMNK